MFPIPCFLSQLLHTELHWLGVPERVVYKLGFMVFMPARLSASVYLVEMCQPVAGVASRQHLRSATQQLLVVPRHQLSSGVTIGWTGWTMSRGPRVPGAPEFQTKKIYIWQHSPNLM